MSLYVVTGGAGFIGSHLTETLLARGERVRVVDSLITGHKRNVQPGAEFVQGDLADLDFARRGIEGRRLRAAPGGDSVGPEVGAGPGDARIAPTSTAR